MTELSDWRLAGWAIKYHRVQPSDVPARWSGGQSDPLNNVLAQSGETAESG